MCAPLHVVEGAPGSFSMAQMHNCVQSPPVRKPAEQTKCRGGLTIECAVHESAEKHAGSEVFIYISQLCPMVGVAWLRLLHGQPTMQSCWALMAYTMVLLLLLLLAWSPSQPLRLNPDDELV